MSTAINKTIKRSKNIPWQVIDNQALVLTPQQSMAHELNETATWIWQQIDSEVTVSAIIEKMCQTFDIDHATAEKDIFQFVNEMTAQGMIECH